MIFNEKLAEVAEKYLHKGSHLYIEGQLQTRKWTDKDGQERFSTEVVLRDFRGELTMLDERRSNGGDARSSERPSAGFGGKPGMRETSAAAVNDLDDDIPF